MENNDLMEIFGLTEEDTQENGQKSDDDKKGSDDDDKSLDDNSPDNNEEGKDDNDLDDEELGEPDDDDREEGDKEDSEAQENSENRDDSEDREEKDGRSAKNAERRRQRDRKIKESQQKLIDEAVSKALKDQQEQTKKIMDSFVVSLGLKSPHDNKPITTVEELTEYRKQADRAQLEKDLKTGKITPEHIKKIVADMPELQPEKEDKAPDEDPQVKAAIEADIKRISELDPSIKSIEDFVKMENHDRFYELVKRGNNFYDAFCMANMDKLVEMKAKAEARKRANLANSKKHMTSKSSRGQGAVTVPPDVMAYYRELMPDATEAEIQKHYNKTIKK